MSTTEKATSTELVPVKFSRLAKRGILQGLNLSQLVVLAAGAATLVAARGAGNDRLVVS